MEMPLTKAELQRINDCIDMMDAWLTQRDLQIATGTYYDDDDEDEELAEGNTIPTPTQPFSDGPPERIHGEGRKDQGFWGPKPKPPIPIEHI
jgi:hypothetical protein